MGATSMNFKTHNDKESLENASNGASLVGTVQATYAELRSLFGKPLTWDDGKVDAQWVVEFSDGTIASVYNWKNGVAYLGEAGLPVRKITDWHIGGLSPAAHTMVQIALDLSRESKEQPKDDVEKAFESAFAVMENIQKTKGEDYALMVELVILTLKRRQLMELLLKMLSDMTEMPKSVGQALAKIDSEISIRTIAKACEASKLDFNTDDQAKELMDCASSVMSCEEHGIEGLIKAMKKDGL
jgi:hypothetical protein